MMRTILALVLVAGCSGADPANRPAKGAEPASHAEPANQGSQTMTQDRRTPGDTGVDEHGVLLRSKPDPSAPKADPALVADDAANLLFFAGGMAGDPALQRKTWVQLQLADAGGTPTPKMTEFIRANQEWVKTKQALIATVDTADKARAYLKDHLK